MKRTFFSALLALVVLTTAQSQTVKQIPKPAETSPQKSVQTERQRAAQAELDKAQDANDEDKFAEAERHAKRALELDPSNKAASIFIAQLIDRQDNRMDDGPEKTAKALEVIAAYQRVATDDPDNDEAYNAISSLYGDIDETELQHSWFMQRAVNPALSAEKRASAYLDLAWLERDCANGIIEQTTNKLYDQKTNRNEPERLDAETGQEISRGQQCALRGLQMTEQALALTPEDDAAWTRKFELLTSMRQLFELAGDDAQAEQYQAQADEANTRASEYKTKRVEAELARMKITVDCGALCDKVIGTPAPLYPAIAKVARAEGAVVVQLTIDEEGNVIYASAVSGPPLLRAAAVQAAKLSTFSPTLQSGKPVKANGVLTYNFTLH